MAAMSLRSIPWLRREIIKNTTRLLVPFLRLYISSSSCRAASADIPDPLSPFLPIIHRLRQVLEVTSCVLT